MQIAPEIAHEIIVHVNGADPEALQILKPHAADVAVITASVNRGFGGACNRAGAVARGELLVFLNDDTEVQPGWLDALLETADAHPEAGAVGSLIYRPDGTIQEVGSFVWRDGSTFAVGRGLRVDSNPYSTVRSVDYCSACSLLVRRSAWDAAGGFDDGYYPAYYEDVDLCFTLRRLGKQILCQPESRVLHHESSSTRADYREFLMRRHRRSFVGKWAAELAERELPEPGSLATAVDSRAVRAIEERITLPGAAGSNRPPAALGAIASDHAYIERELLLKSEFLAELQRKLAEAEERIQGLAGSEAQLREGVAELERKQSDYSGQVQELRQLLLQPRHRLVERINAALKRNAGFLHRALKSLLRARGFA